VVKGALARLFSAHGTMDPGADDVAAWRRSSSGGSGHGYESAGLPVDGTAPQAAATRSIAAQAEGSSTGALDLAPQPQGQHNVRLMSKL
jgi:hypothetical protein